MLGKWIGKWKELEASAKQGQIIKAHSGAFKESLLQFISDGAFRSRRLYSTITPKTAITRGFIARNMREDEGGAHEGVQCRSRQRTSYSRWRHPWVSHAARLSAHTLISNSSQFYDLIEIFRIGGYAPHTNYLFLGASSFSKGA